MEYFISIKNEKRGPYTVKELKERNLDAATLVMPADGTTWIPAWQINELRPLFISSVTPNAVNISEKEESEVAQDVSVQPIEQENITHTMVDPIYTNNNHNANDGSLQAPKKKSYRYFTVFLVFFFILLTLCFTCPTKDDHKQALTNVVTQTMNDVTKQIDNTSPFGDIGQAFATMFLSTIERTIHASIDNLLQVDNYGICSIGKIRLGGEEKIVSVGILTHIFTVDKEEIEEEFTKQFKADDDVWSGKIPTSSI